MRLLPTVMVLLAILARSIVPVGYMAQTSSDGVFEIVICTGGGTDTVRVDADGNPVEDIDGPSQNDGTCPYALGSVSVLAEASDVGVTFTRQESHFAPQFVVDQHVPVIITTHNAARASPVLI